ncbi:hypothetical protein C9167_25430 [Escherichia coli]|nr:hypothetical protein F7F12_21670 [Escherichia coli]TJG79017.1 hypothetical protein C9167_25430 [Escherichia coli]
MTIKSQKCAFFRADPPRGQATPPGGPAQIITVINCNKTRFLPPSHRTGDHEGTTPRSVNAVNPGVYRF